VIKIYSKYVLEKQNEDDACPSLLLKISEIGNELGPVTLAATQDLNKFVLGKVLNQQVSSPNRLLATRDSHASLILGFPELDHSENEVYVWPRGPEPRVPPSAPRRTPGNYQHEAVILHASGQVTALQS
jgi:hypothetical protein